MERQNSLVIAENGRITHIGEGVLPYIELNRARPFAYPGGKLERNDVVLFVSRSMPEEDCGLFEGVGVSFVGARRECVEGALLLGVFENPEIQSVEKYGPGLFEVETEGGEAPCVLLDTFFYGTEFRVTWERQTGTLTAGIGGQLVECRLDADRDQLIVLGEEGIRYFRDDDGESRRDENAALLSGETFHGYVDAGRLASAGLRDLLPEGIADRVERIPPGERELFGGQRGIVSVVCEEWEFGGNAYRAYTICAAKGLLARMEEETELYRELSRARETAALRPGGRPVPTTFGLWGNDENLAGVKRLLQKACDTNVTVLLTGESGTGKTFLAKEIHKSSRRSQKAFVHVNCAAIPYHLIESELFGYEDGAFTGAKKGGRKGYFEMANGGTIFLDEITEMPLSLQGKLLEVIQNRTFYRVGGTEKIHINVRLIAATNRDLKEQVAAKEFREDLYYRINVFPIELPPLRKRKDAILAIVTDILPGICEKVELEPLLISPQALAKIRNFDWPGNIRELENVLEKAAILCDGKVILPEDIVLPQGGKASVRENTGTLAEQRARAEKQAIVSALTMFDGDRGRTARYLDIGRTSLFEKMKKYKIRDRWEGLRDDDTE